MTSKSLPVSASTAQVRDSVSYMKSPKRDELSRRRLQVYASSSFGEVCDEAKAAITFAVFRI